ncbi:hypothetical protein V2J09_018097 [Rumex salicifolius]
MDHIANSPALFFLILFTFCIVISGSTFTMVNKCDYTVWPGVLSSSGSSPLQTTGFQLQSGESSSLQVPPGWSGRVWARTRCNFDPNTGEGSCGTGDCGSGQIQCNGAGAIRPATLAEFTIGSSGSATQDFYDVSLVDGYNLPMSVDASGGSGSCQSTGCAEDLNQQCPSELRAGDGGACKSACEAFGTDEYCCRGAYGSPDSCRASVYAQMFKTLCPRAYSYAYDDSTSTFTCGGADYTITFCPTITSQKSSREASGRSGSGNGATVATGGSWLSNVMFSGGGYSLTSLSSFASQLTVFASAVTFLLLHSVCL